MTHRMSATAVRALATARDREVAQVMAAIDGALADPAATRQHAVVYGPRGSGKSFLMRLVELAVADRGLGDRAAFVLLPEEQYNIKTAPRLLEVVAARLAGRPWQDSGYRMDFRDPAAAWRDAVAMLDTALDARFGAGQGLAIVGIENFDALLKRLFGADLPPAGAGMSPAAAERRSAEERLRKLMARRGGRLMLLATATGTVDMDYERPLFRAFLDIDLRDWSGKDVVAYCARRRAFEDRPALTARQVGRAWAIAECIGGNPRLAHLLYEELSAAGTPRRLAATLDALVDELSDYYRHRMEELSPTAAGLLDALVRIEPVSQTGLAAAVGATQNRIAEPFRMLTAGRLLAAQQETGGKALRYRVRDRLFVHFYRQRYGNPDAVSGLEHVADLLAAFYTPAEARAEGLRAFTAGNLDDARVLFRLGRAGEPMPPDLARVADHWLRFEVPRTLAELGGLSAADIAGDINAIRDQPGAARDRWAARAAAAEDGTVRTAFHVARAVAALAAGEAEEALAICQSARDAAAGEADACLLAHHFGSELRQYLTSLPPTVEPDRDDLLGWLTQATNAWCRSLGAHDLGRDRMQAGQHHDAIAAFDMAATAASQAGDSRRQARCLRQKGWNQGRLGDHAIAMETLDAAFRGASKADDPGLCALCLLEKGGSQGQLGDHAAAIRTLDAAFMLAEQAGDLELCARCLWQKGWNQGELSDHAAAIETLDTAFALTRQDGNLSGRTLCLLQKGRSQGELGDHAAAIETLDAACAWAGKTDDPGLCASCLLEKGKNQAQSGDHAGAIETLDAAVASAGQADDVSLGASCLLQKGWSQDRLGDHVSAINDCRSAMAWADRSGKAPDRYWARVQGLLLASDIKITEALSWFEAMWDIHNHARNLPPPAHWWRDLAAAIARASLWPALAQALARHADWIAGDPPPAMLSGVGTVWAERAGVEGRAAMVAEIAAALPILKALIQRLDRPGHRPQPVSGHAGHLIYGLVAGCDDPGLLRDVADELVAVFADAAAAAAASLHAAADFHAAGRTEAALETIDPDRARMIRRLWTLPDPEDVLARKGRRKGR